MFVGQQPAANFVPTDETAHIFIVDIDVGIDFATYVFVKFLVGIAVVDGKKDDAMLFAEVNGFLQIDTIADSPQDEFMSAVLQGFEDLESTGNYLANVGVTVLDNGAIEIDSDDLWVRRISFFPHCDGRLK